MLGTIVGTCVIVAITIAIGVVADKRFAILPRKEVLRPRPPGHAPGESPAMAIRTRPAQLATLRANQRCRDCRARLEAQGSDDTVRYGERTLAVLHFRCPGCVRNQALYVEPTA